MVAKGINVQNGLSAGFGSVKTLAEYRSPAFPGAASDILSLHSVQKTDSKALGLAPCGCFQFASIFTFTPDSYTPPGLLPGCQFPALVGYHNLFNGFDFAGVPKTVGPDLNLVGGLFHRYIGPYLPAEVRLGIVYCEGLGKVFAGKVINFKRLPAGYDGSQ